jgi:hypothetical protein
MSRVQIVGAGQARGSRDILHSPELKMAIDALSQVYDHIILDAGTLDDLPDQLATNNGQAVLVTQSAFDEQIRDAVANELIRAGFNGVSVVEGANDNFGPVETDPKRTAA